MKKTKIALTLVCAILLVAASVMCTLAYLTSTPGAVTNTFTVGSDVVITLDEAPVDANGKKTNGTRGNGNSYKLLPGHEYDKDPTVHVKGESCYVFVKVTNAISTIEDTSNTIASQMTSNGWVAVAGYNGVYIYNKTTGANKTAVSGSETAPTDLPVFATFKIKGDLDHTALSTYATTETNGMNITINAYAIQSDGLESKTPAEIWAILNPTT